MTLRLCPRLSILTPHTTFTPAYLIIRYTENLP